MVMKNKRGWMRVLEVFVALLLITSVSLIIINREYAGKNDEASAIYDAEISILREIQLDENLRTEVLNPNLPVVWEDFPSELKSKIEEKTPNYLNCTSKICSASGICDSSLPSGKDIYVQYVVITANLEKYAPRILKLFCWRK